MKKIVSFVLIFCFGLFAVYLTSCSKQNQLYGKIIKTSNKSEIVTFTDYETLGNLQVLVETSDSNIVEKINGESDYEIELGGKNLSLYFEIWLVEKDVIIHPKDEKHSDLYYKSDCFSSSAFLNLAGLDKGEYSGKEVKITNKFNQEKVIEIVSQTIDKGFLKIKFKNNTPDKSILAVGFTVEQRDASGKDVSSNNFTRGLLDVKSGETSDEIEWYIKDLGVTAQISCEIIWYTDETIWQG